MSRKAADLVGAFGKHASGNHVAFSHHRRLKGRFRVCFEGVLSRL